MWFWFDFATWWQMVRLSWNERNPRARRRSLVTLLAWVPLVASFHALCFFLDGLLFPALWRTRVKAPVFVLGHARSGTTLVHRLMSGDSGRFSYFALWEMYFPSLLQKKLIRLGGEVDRRWLGGALARRVAAWEARRYAAVRKMHEMGLQQPEEDDMVLYYSCASGFWITKLPYMGDLDFYSVDRMPPRKRRRLMRFYEDCVRRQLCFKGPDKTHLSKNPIFSGRVESLIERFPDVRIVVPLRNPYETIPSLLSLVSAGWRSLDWDADRVSRCLRVLAEQSFDTYRYPLEVLARHPETPHAIVDYRDLTADPAATIERVYGQLGLHVSAEYGEVLQGEGKRARQHRPGHTYSLEKFGLEADAIRARLEDLFETYHWGDEAPAAAPAEEGS